MDAGCKNPACQSSPVFRVRLLRQAGLSQALQRPHAPYDSAAESRLMPTRKLIVDGKEIEADEGITLLQACEQAGAEIPRFCYHERLSVAGNCRMCLVGGEKAPEPIASWGYPVADGVV